MKKLYNKNYTPNADCKLLQTQFMVAIDKFLFDIDPDVDKIDLEKALTESLKFAIYAEE